MRSSWYDRIFSIGSKQWGTQVKIRKPRNKLFGILGHLYRKKIWKIWNEVPRSMVWKKWGNLRNELHRFLAIGKKTEIFKNLRQIVTVGKIWKQSLREFRERLERKLYSNLSFFLRGIISPILIIFTWKALRHPLISLKIFRF